MKSVNRFPAVSASLLITALAPCASAQLTWDPLDSNWDLTTANWRDPSSAFTTWNNTGTDEAVFPTGGTIDIADGGVTVGNLTTDGLLTLQSLTDNLGVITIAPGGATWDTTETEIEFLNNQANDTPLSISTGDTLTLVGGGTFDTGERPNGANWIAAGATLNVSEAAVVRGNAGSIGQFETVQFVDGSRYLHERNSDQGYSNNWELVSGTIFFDNRFQRNYTLNGDLSGDGGMRVEFMANRQIILNGTNTFTGGIEVSNASRVTATANSISSGDLILSGSTDTNGGILRLLGTVDLGSRSITLNGTGGSLVNGGLISLDGDISGDGNLQIGNAAFPDNVNLITLSGSGDYTGTTRIYLGGVVLGADEALGQGVMTIGGGSNGGRASRLILNGHTQTVTGLTTADSNTRQIVNLNATSTGSAPGTLILDIADDAGLDEEFFYGSALGVTEADDRGSLNLVKNGDGAIGLGNVRISESLQINDGQLRLGNSAGASVVGDVTNNATLVIDEAATASSFTSGPSSTTTFNWEVSDWTDVAGTGFTQLNVTGDVTLDPTSSLNIVIEEVNLANFIESDASFTVVTVGGTPSLVPSQITLDSSGFTSGTGTWALRIDGTNVVLDYTTGASDPYDTWAAGFPTLTGGFADDDDGDGIANGLEYYFFNSDPTAASNLSQPLCVGGSAGSGNLVFSHDRPIDSSGITATYEWSTTLEGPWTASGDTNGGTSVSITPGTPNPAAAGYETVEVTTSSSPTTLDTLFARLSVSRP